MSALFNFSSFLRLAILVICTATYLRRKFPSLVAKKDGNSSFFYKCSVIGDRLSPYVSLCCFAFGVKMLIGYFI